MSSSIAREPLEGTIQVDQKIVGAICLPEADVEDFVDQFNHCYGPMRMRISAPALNSQSASKVAPVGASRQLPVRIPGQPRKP